MALDIPKMWARRMEGEMKDWEEPVAPTEQQHGRMVFPDTLPCECEIVPPHRSGRRGECDHAYYRYFPVEIYGPDGKPTAQAPISSGFSVCLKCRRVEFCFPGDGTPTIFTNGWRWTWEDPFPGFFRRYFRNLWRALRGEGL